MGAISGEETQEQGEVHKKEVGLREVSPYTIFPFLVFRKNADGATRWLSR